MRRLLPVFICIAAGCGGDAAEEAATPDISPQAAMAARHACAAEELARTAFDDLATIEAGFGAGVAPEGLTTYARAYLQHANLRLLAYAHDDSAANHSSSPQDSIRHARAADQMQIIAPREGTLEANVLRAYEQKAAAILADADHPCNWKHELTK